MINHNKKKYYLKQSCTIAHLHIISFLESLSIKQTNKAI